MNLLLLFLCFLILLLIILFIIMSSKIRKLSAQSRNKVHFYVARDKNGRLFLYLSKPFRRGDEFFSNERGNIMLRDLKCFGLNPDDFKDLKWEDEPVEVFLNLDD